MLKKIASYGLMLSMFSFTSYALAADVSVSKLRINLENGQTADFLNLHNQSKIEKEAFEISLQKWSQKENPAYKDNKEEPMFIDVLENTEDILVSPKTAVIMPDKDKIVRVIINNKEEAEKNYSYRLIINQLPSQEVAVQKNTINLLFKISLPIFVYKDPIKKIDKMDIKHTFSKEKDKDYITFTNKDKQHIQIQSLEVNEGKSSVNNYLLSNSITKMELPSEFSLSNLKSKPLTVVTDKGTLTIQN